MHHKATNPFPTVTDERYAPLGRSRDECAANQQAGQAEVSADEEIQRILDSVNRGEGKLLVSGCLAGLHCRYDCGSCLIESVKKLVDEGKALAICPEQLGGLPTPRTPSEIVGGDGTDVIDGKARVIMKTGEDVTRFFLAGAEAARNMAASAHALMAVLKARSPSCGCGRIYDGSFTGATCDGEGIAAAVLRRAGIKVINEDTWQALQGSRPLSGD